MQQIGAAPFGSKDRADANAYKIFQHVIKNQP